MNIGKIIEDHKRKSNIIKKLKAKLKYKSKIDYIAIVKRIDDLPPYEYDYIYFKSKDLLKLRKHLDGKYLNYEIIKSTDIKVV